MNKLVISMLLGSMLLAAAPVLGQERGLLRSRIHEVMNHERYEHSRFGMRFYSLADQEVIFELNADEFFIPGSTAKLFPAGTVLETLGPDHRFHTRVYRTGPVVKGRLEGDLVLVASADFNLSNRIQPDGTLAFSNIDHSYDTLPGAAVVAGDPLAVIRKIAGQVAAEGVREIEGYVRVDDSLFGEGTWPQGMPDTPVSAVVSPIVVNDNIVDLTVSPAARPGEAATLEVAPDTAYVEFLNRTSTGAEDSHPVLQFPDDVRNPDGTRTVTVSGSIPVGHPAVLRAYRVPEPRTFAETVLLEALREAGVEGRIDVGPPPDFESLSRHYTPDNQVAEHVSPPLIEAIKVILKVSQNLHAATLTYLLGAVVGQSADQANAVGFGIQRGVFENLGLDPKEITQNDGAGVDTRVTPGFTVAFLEHFAAQPYFRGWLNAQPIMGKDGTEADIQEASAAAGRVYAKSGLDGILNLVTPGAFTNGRGLGGYIEGRDGQIVAFAIFVNFVPTADYAEMVQVGQDLGQIVAAVYESLDGDRTSVSRLNLSAAEE